MENQAQNHNETNVRDISNLYTPQITYNCALGLGSNNSSPCVVCAYKIGLFDVALDKEFTRRVPNKRPETCPRSNVNSSSSSFFINNQKSKIKKRKRQQEQSLESTSNDTLVGYEKGMNILTVGDGDFSFSLSLARKLLSSNENEKTISATTRIVATSYESKATLLSTYPNIQDTISELEDLGVHLFYQIDATKLNSYRHLFFDNGDESIGNCPHQPRSNDSSCFQRIVWNFPCSAEPNGQDGQNSEMELNKKMVRTFIKEVSSFHPKTEVTKGKQKERSSLVSQSQSLLDSNCGEIHMTHKTKPPYNQWKMEDIANFFDSENFSSEGVRVEYLGRIVFDRCCYFPYVPRKALDKKSFPCHGKCILFLMTMYIKSEELLPLLCF